MREISEYLWVKSIGISSKSKVANNIDSCQGHALFSSHLISDHITPEKYLWVTSIGTLNSKASNNNNSCQIHALHCFHRSDFG